MRLGHGLFALVILLTPHRGPAQDPSVVAFVNATVVDVERGALVPRQTIVTSRGRIEQVGPVASTRVPRGATRIDLAGRFVIPGLWDMHVHIGGVPTHDADALVGYFGSLFLANGVTGVRDAGSDGPRIASMDSMGRARPGSMPRLVYAREKVGPAPGASWSAGDAQRAIASRVTAGAQYIKLAPGYPVSSLRATLEACARVRRQCVAHVPPTDPALWLSPPWGGSYEHLFNLSEHVSRVPASELFVAFREYNAPKLWHRVAYKLRLRQRPADPASLRVTVRDTSKDREFFTRIASSGTWLTPTLILHHQLTRTMPLLPAAVDSTLVRSPAPPEPDRTAASVDVARRTWQLWAGLVRAMHVAGVSMLAGTDFTERHVPGAVLHAELALLQQEGVPAPDVLRMATLNPARYLGTTDSSGSVAVGKVADLVVLGANPLDDVRNVASVEMVMTRGHLLRRSALDSLTSTARTALGRIRAIDATQRP